jgi:hypothetical protein
MVKPINEMVERGMRDIMQEDVKPDWTGGGFSEKAQRKKSNPQSFVSTP